MSKSQFKGFKEYAEFVKSVKRKKKLHSVVEERLIYLLSRLYPETFSTSEVAGVLGGRNDVIQFFFNQRKVVFELFFSPSQVPQDLRLLEQSDAQVKIAILLDEQIEPKLATEYFRKKPDHFPYLWLRYVMLQNHETFCSVRLRELIDENSSIVRLRRLLSLPTGGRLEEILQKQLQQIEVKLETTQPDIELKKENLTIRQVFAFSIISRIHKLGVPITRLRSLHVWLQDNIEYAFTLVDAGFQTFLITDLDGGHAIWSDGDFADGLILGAEENDNADIVMCLNKLINNLMIKMGYEPSPVRWHFFHNYAESEFIFIPPAGNRTDETDS